MGKMVLDKDKGKNLFFYFLFIFSLRKIKEDNPPSAASKTFLANANLLENKKDTHLA